MLRKQESFLKFVLNAIQDSCPTPSRLKCWSQASAGDGKCPLGCGKAGTLKHILCACVKAIKEAPQSRITWRHDSVLLAIYRGVMDAIEEAGKDEDVGVSAATVTFKTDSGKEYTKASTALRDPSPKNVLSGASDWKVQFDLNLGLESEKDRPFPSEVAVVTGKGSRPDGIIWSMETKTIIWIELTSPWEENFKKNYDLKFKRYNQLAIDLREGKHFGVKWTVYPHYVEIGARGGIHELGWGRMCTQLGISGKARRSLTESVQDAAIHCSHYIFLCRFHLQWEPQQLIDTWKK